MKEVWRKPTNPKNDWLWITESKAMQEIIKRTKWKPDVKCTCVNMKCVLTIPSSKMEGSKKIKRKLAFDFSLIDWDMSKNRNRATEADKQRDWNIDRTTLIIVESPPSKCCLLDRPCGKLLSMQALTQISCVCGSSLCSGKLSEAKNGFSESPPGQ